VIHEAIAILKQQGAVIVYPADLPSVVASDPTKNILLWNTCSGVDNRKGRDQDCSVVLKYGMKRDFNRWLATLGPAAPVRSLTGLREFNLAHKTAGAIKYGQSQLDISDEMDLDADRARYEADRAKAHRTGLCFRESNEAPRATAIGTVTRRVAVAKWLARTPLISGRRL
jgi:amidase